MKIIVFGSTGSVGKLVVKQALEDGHEVTAFARNPHKLEIHHNNLRLHTGDAMDAASVSEAVKGHEAAIITLGSGMSRKSIIRSRGTLNVIEAMHRHGVRRLVCQSTLGAHESWDNLNFFWKYVMFGFLLRPIFLDHQVQEDLVRASGLDWTIVRPSAFTDGPVQRTYKEAFKSNVNGLSLKISRGDVADFLKRQLRDKSYLRQAVAISN